MLVTSRWIAGVEGDDAWSWGYRAEKFCCCTVTGQRSNQLNYVPNLFSPG